MIAAAILALVLASSLTVMQRAFVTIDVARGSSYAAQIMQNELEKLRLQNWSTVSGYSSASTPLTVASSFTNNSSIGNKFTLTRTASTIRTGMIQLTYTVTWKTYDGREHTRTYTTYYGKNGLYDYVSS